MANMQDLREIYESFCSFGSSRNLATGANGSNDNIDGPCMDGAKFVKFCKDCKIIGNKVTVTDVDILFKKCIPKGARRMDWNMFCQAFQMLADKRYPDRNPKDAFNQLLHAVCDKGPIARATIPEANGIFDKLTNTQLYTGTHKERFDANGIGRGGDGRQVIDSRTHDLSQLVNRKTNSAVPNNTYSGANVSNSASGGAAKKRGQASVVTASSEGLDVKSQAVKRNDVRSSNSKLSGVPANVARSSGSLAAAKSNSSVNKSSGSINAKPKAQGNSSVFDRLTNVNSYTGSHKERFNSDGTGRGIAGRDAPSLGSGHGTYRGGDVKDLSQILRS